MNEDFDQKVLTMARRVPALADATHSGLMFLDEILTQGSARRATPGLIVAIPLGLE